MDRSHRSDRRIRTYRTHGIGWRDRTYRSYGSHGNRNVDLWNRGYSIWHRICCGPISNGNNLRDIVLADLATRMAANHISTC